ncbi:MAG: HAMP domain-containing protein [Alcaligenaceae bacterium]|nr:HAMP domain-containing protein [Alcaligenaceae bacterium]
MKKKLRLFKHTTGIGTRLSVTNFLITALLVVGILTAVYILIARMVQNDQAQGVAKNAALISSMLQSTHRGLDENAKRVIEAYRAINNETIANGVPPADALAYMQEQIRRMAQTSGVALTVLEKESGGYRVVISAQDQDNTALVDDAMKQSRLAEAFAANRSVEALSLLGDTYTFNRLQPLTDAQGNPAGWILAQIDFSGTATLLRQAIGTIKTGDTGYFYVIDATTGPTRGNMLVHPTLVGKNVLSLRDSDGNDFISEMLQKRQGVIFYGWMNPGLGETVAREKIVAYATFEPWGWLIAGGSYVSEYTHSVTVLLSIMVWIGLAAVLLASVIWFFLIRRMIVRPISRVEQVADAIARGDLTQTLQVQRGDEIGRMVASINAISTGLSDIVFSVRSNAEALATATQQIRQSNQDISDRTHSQAAALEQTSSAMTELEQTVQQNSDTSREASERVNHAARTANQGGVMVNKVVGTMKDIHQSSERIASIVGVIDSIAFQTNILALNAAVEAARAGEHGKGFAVVASEVRSLSAKSAASAREIRELIASSVERVNAGSELVDQAGKTMEQVVADVGTVAQLMSEIRLAGEEQSAGVKMVTDAITQMDKNTSMNATLTGQMVGAARDLQDQAHDLVALVGRFRVAGHVAGLSAAGGGMAEHVEPSEQAPGQTPLLRLQ